ncbi:hypothetical protein Franean1_1296 [Parafrankia sp. EAN1pec]|nr:hypothetical protein Franean1_1296 [Frankia sp. EAN1pec]
MDPAVHRPSCDPAGAAEAMGGTARPVSAPGDGPRRPAQGVTETVWRRAPSHASHLAIMTGRRCPVVIRSETDYSRIRQARPGADRAAGAGGPAPRSSAVMVRTWRESPRRRFVAPVVRGAMSHAFATWRSLDAFGVPLSVSSHVSNDTLTDAWSPPPRATATPRAGDPRETAPLR